MLRLLTKDVFGDLDPQKCLGVFLLFLLTICSSGATEKETEIGALCRYEEDLVSENIYQRLIGWHCYEEVKTAHEAVTYVCQTEEYIKIPCIKVKGSYLDFGNFESQTTLTNQFSPEKFEELLNCFTATYNCSNASFHSGVRIWQPGTDTSICSTETRNKLHISLLSISLVLGIPAIIISSYFSWTEEGFTYEVIKVQRNLIIATTFRSFITLLIQSEIILPYAQNSTVNEEGIPALAVFETLSLNIVFALWLIFAYFVWKCVRSEYTITPNINLYSWITTGTALGVTILWIIVVASTQTSKEWVGFRDWDQWINDSVRIVFLLLQLYVVVNVVMKITKDPGKGGHIGRRVRWEALYILILTPIFILQFALNAGTPNDSDCAEGFYYTLYFIDGLQGALVCLFFFYFDSEVLLLLANIFGLKKITEDTPIRTLDSLKDKPSNLHNFSGSNDVVYSSVVTPENYEKTLHLYNRQNLVGKPSVTMLDGDAFVTCDADRKISTVSQYYDANSYTEFHEIINSESNPPEQGERSRNERSITPIHESKFATINKSSHGVDPHVPKRFSITSSSSCSSTTSGESIKNYPLAMPVSDKPNIVRKENNYHLKAAINVQDLQRQSTEALKGSSSEESLQRDYQVPCPVPPLRKKRLTQQEATSKWLEDRQSYPPTIKVTSPSIDHEITFPFSMENVKDQENSGSLSENDVREKIQNVPSPSVDSLKNGSEDIILKENDLDDRSSNVAPKIIPRRKNNDHKSYLSKDLPSVNKETQLCEKESDSSDEDVIHKTTPMKRVSSSSSSEGEFYIKPTVENSSSSVDIIKPLEGTSNQPNDENLSQISNNPEHNFASSEIGFLQSDLDNIDKKLNLLMKSPRVQHLSINNSDELVDDPQTQSFESDGNEIYGSKDIDTDLDNSDSEVKEFAIKKVEIIDKSKIELVTISFASTSSSSSTSTDDEEERQKDQYSGKVAEVEINDHIFDVPPPLRKEPEKLEYPVKIKSTYDGTENIQNGKEANHVENDDAIFDVPLPLRKKKDLEPELPNIYDDLKEDGTQSRPKSIAENKRQTFSKMFSNHRNKLLTSKSENDFLGSNSAIRKSQEGSLDNLNYEALASPTEYSKDSFQRGLTSFDAVENLNEADDFLEMKRKIVRTNSSSDQESDCSVISSDTVKDSTISPKMVLQNIHPDDWEPQNVAI